MRLQHESGEYPCRDEDAVVVDLRFNSQSVISLQYASPCDYGREYLVLSANRGCAMRISIFNPFILTFVLDAICTLVDLQ